jgi:hypothetical protein
MMFLPILVLLVAVGPQSSDDPCRQAANAPGYDVFIGLPEAERADAFNAQSPAAKACLKRTHASRWLAENRGSLSARQIQVVEKAIDFLTPEIYQSPDDPEIRAREAALKNELACELGRDRTARAFKFTSDAVKGRSPSKGLIESGLEWFSDCVTR